MKKVMTVGVAAVVLLAAGCKQKPQADAKIPITPQSAPADSIHQAAPPATPFQAQLDSGNMAYRAKDYKAAKEHYTKATEIDATKGAAWFGVYMAEDKLGNKAAAELAIKKAQELNPAFDASSAPMHSGATGANPHEGVTMPPKTQQPTQKP